MDYVQLTLDDYIQCKTEIKENLCGIVKSFVRIGWQLTRINKSEAYKLDGYNSITEFAKAEYDMNPDGVSRFMNVYERYSVPGDTPELKERYRDFKFAQLSEMLQLPEEDQAMIQPDTKRADIRELKKFNKDNENNPDALLNWQTGQQDKVTETILEFYRSQKETLNGLYSSEAYQTGNIRRMAEIINPSGSRSFKKGTVFLMMHGPDKGITVKQIPQGSRNMTWEEFFSITQALFAEAAAGDRTYDNYFHPESQKTAQEEKSPSASEDAKAQPGFAPAQETGQKEEKSQETAEETKETLEITPEEPEQKPNTQENEPEEEKEEPKEEPAEEPEDQIPGQDEIMNHPEYMPKEPPKEKGKTKLFTLHGEGYGDAWAHAVKVYLEAGYKKPDKKAEFTSLHKTYIALKKTEVTTFYNELGDTLFDVENKRLAQEYDSFFPEEQKEEIAPAQPETEATDRQQTASETEESEILDKPITRKEYIDSLTLFGTAEYLAESMKGFGNVTWSRLQEDSFWEEWLSKKVDHAGRAWVD